MSLFEVVIHIKDDFRPKAIEYFSIEECLRDGGLKALFVDKEIEECYILQDGVKVTNSLPPAIMSWKRFKDQLVSNSSRILRRLVDED